jgi:hypothetical protein
MAPGDFRNLRQGERAGSVEDRACDRRRSLRDRRFNLPAVGAARAGIAEVPNLDERDSGGPQRVVVRVAMPALNDNLAAAPETT